MLVASLLTRCRRQPACQGHEPQLRHDTPLNCGGPGYVGVDGIDTVPFKRLPGSDLYPSQVEFNTTLSKMRAAVEHAIAPLKTWRMLSEEGGRYRAPIGKYKSVVKAVVGLFFFKAYE
jgi:DDE superfamily endonuclease